MSEFPVTPAVFSLFLEPVTFFKEESHRAAHSSSRLTAGQAVRRAEGFLLLVFGLLGGIMIVNLILAFCRS